MGTIKLALSADYLNELSTTGTITPVGDMTVHTAGALAAGPSGSLYMTQQTSQNPDLLYSLNTTTGAATTKGSIGFNNVYSMVYDNGTMYGFDTTNDILTIDLSNGTGNKVGTSNMSGSYISGASLFVPTSPVTPSVPEPGVMGMLLSGGVSTTLFMFRRRRS
jgi:hypothetical protein